MARTPRPSRASQVETNDNERVVVRLFDSFHEGYGWADRPAIDQQGPFYHYHRVHGSIDARQKGRLSMGYRIRTINSTAYATTPVFAAAWLGKGIYYFNGSKVLNLANGTVAEVGTDLLANTATDGMLDDDGSGIPYLYACFGGVSTGPKLVRMSSSDLDGGTKSTHASLVAGSLLAINGDAYRTIRPTGGTADCQVSKCPLGSDRFTATAWGSGVTVGFAGTGINALVAVRQAPVAVKPEGIFAYNAGLNRWINYAKSWEASPHTGNGVRSYPLGDVLIVPMGDGGTVLFDGNNVKPFNALNDDALLNEHTPRDRFSTTRTTDGGALSSWRQWLFAVNSNFLRTVTAPTTQRVFFYNNTGAAFTDHSAAMRVDTTTLMTFTYDETTDAIYIGLPRPFISYRFLINTPNLVARTMTVAISTSDTAFTSIGVKDTGFRDFTESPVGTPFGQTGEIQFMTDPVEAGWVRGTVNSVTLYWVRITFSGALTAAVVFRNGEIQPWYPGLDPTNFPLDGLDRSGVLPHVFTSRIADDGKVYWHNIGSLPVPDTIGVIVYGDTGNNASQANDNLSRALALIGRYGVYVFNFGFTGYSGDIAMPLLNGVGLIEASSFVPVPDRLVRLKRIFINGYQMDSALSCFFYYTWDYQKPWSRFGSRVKNFPAVLDAVANSTGHRFRWAIGFTNPDAAVVRNSQPFIETIDAEFEILPDRLSDSVGRSVALTPPRF